MSPFLEGGFDHHPTSIGIPPTPPFRPDSLSGLVLWIDARSLTGVVLNGGLVTTWPDMSGNGNDLASSGTARPKYFDNTPTNAPVVRFRSPGTPSTYMSALFTLNQPHTVAARLDTTSLGGHSHVWDGNVADVGDFETDVGNFVMEAGATLVGPPFAPINGWHFFACFYDGANSDMQLDGASVASGNAGVFDPGGIVLGASATPGLHAKFDIAALYIFDRQLTAIELSHLQAYR